MDHGGRSPFTGNWPNGQALPHCGTRSSLGVALNVLPNAELLAVDARHQPPAPSNRVRARLLPTGLLPILIGKPMAIIARVSGNLDTLFCSKHDKPHSPIHNRGPYARSLAAKALIAAVIAAAHPLAGT